MLEDLHAGSLSLRGWLCETLVDRASRRGDPLVEVKTTQDPVSQLTMQRGGERKTSPMLGKLRTLKCFPGLATTLEQNRIATIYSLPLGAGKGTITWPLVFGLPVATELSQGRISGKTEGI